MLSACSMEKIKNIHPGEVLLEEFLIPLQISVYRLAKETFIPQSRISGIVKGNRSITADTALRLARFFGTTPHFWLGLQADFDLEVERNDHQQEIDSIQSIQDNAA